MNKNNVPLDPNIKRVRKDLLGGDYDPLAGIHRKAMDGRRECPSQHELAGIIIGKVRKKFAKHIVDGGSLSCEGAEGAVKDAAIEYRLFFKNFELKTGTANLITDDIVNWSNQLRKRIN